MLMILALSTWLATTLAPNHPPTTGSVVDFTLDLRNDLGFRQLSAPVTIIRSGAPEVTTSTGPTGTTPSVELQQGFPFTVITHEHSNGTGISLGQLAVRDAPTIQPLLDAYTYHLTTTQPVATALSFSTATDYYTADPYHTRWTFSVPVGDPGFNFPAHVAMLLNPRDIQAYCRYYGISWTGNTTDARLGIFLRTPAVELGTGGLIVQLDCRGHGFNLAPTPKSFLIKDHGVVPPATLTFSAQIIDWRDEVATLFLSGRLERGDTCVLLLPHQEHIPTGRVEQPDLAFVLTHPASVTGTCPPVDAGTAPPGFTCEPAAPTSHAGCDPSAPSSLKVCVSSSDTMGPDYVCLPAGSSQRRGTKWEYTGSFSVSTSVTIFGQAIEATATGSISYSTEQDTTYVAETGTACGSCSKQVVDIIHCRRPYLIQRPKSKWIRDDGALILWPDGCTASTVSMDCENAPGTRMVSCAKNPCP